LRRFLATAVLLAGIVGGWTDASASSGTSVAAGKLDGSYIALGPLASAQATETRWDAGFGGVLLFARVRERSALVAWGAGTGGMRVAHGDYALVWGELFLATDRGLGVPVGASAGPLVHIDEVQPARFGWHVGAFLYAGVMPYVRVGLLPDDRGFVDAGLVIPLPAVKWR